ncbi:hypothetical protein [Parabacteroides sp.]
MTIKPYPTDETQPSQHVSEPAVSYGLSQNIASLKLEAIDELMKIFDPERLSQAVDYLRSLGREEGRDYPYCPSSIDAMKQELAEAEDDFANGRVFSSDELRAGVRIAMEQSRQGLGITHEEMRNRKRPWRK